ncbi:MAG: tetratricopeptide repeat protein, partial [Lutibacter sp.]
MKYIKVIFLIFLVFNLLQITSCNNKERIETSEKPSADAVISYMEKMKDASLGDTICLKYANKAIEIEKKTNPNSKRIEEILGHKIYLLSNLKQLDSAIHISKELLQITIRKNDSVAIGSNYARLAYYYSLNHKKDSAFLSYERSKQIHINLGDSAKIGENLAQMAIIQSDLGDYSGSDNNSVQALKYINKNNEQYLNAIYNCLAISSRKQNDYQEAIYWYDKAISISTNELSKVTCQNNKANAYRDLKEYEKSISLLSEILNDTILINNPKTEARIIDNLAFTKWSANKNAVVLPDLLKALSIRINENDLFGLIASYAHLSDYYKEKSPKTALEYATKMYKQAKDLKSPHDQLEALEKLIEFDTSNKAKEYYNRYVKLNDSVNEA